MSDESGAPIRRKLPKIVAWYVVAVLIGTLFMAASDSARPPYVGWKTEMAASAVLVTSLAGMIYWEWYR